MQKKNETRTTERGEIINNTPPIFTNNTNSTIYNALIRDRLKYYNQVAEKLSIKVATGAQIRPCVNLSYDQYKLSPFKHHKSLWESSLDNNTCIKRGKCVTDHKNNHGSLSEINTNNNNLFLPAKTLHCDL